MLLLGGGGVGFAPRMAVSSAKTARCLFNAALARAQPETEHQSLILGVISWCSEAGVNRLCSGAALD